jgi:hypothetical protein
MQRHSTSHSGSAPSLESGLKERGWVLGGWDLKQRVGIRWLGSKAAGGYQVVGI